MTLNRIIAGNIILIKVIDRFPLGKTILMGLLIMLLGTLFLVVIGIWFTQPRAVLKQIMLERQAEGIH
mgnify:CR=1 FL=1